MVEQLVGAVPKTSKLEDALRKLKKSRLAFDDPFACSATCSSPSTKELIAKKDWESLARGLRRARPRRHRRDARRSAVPKTRGVIFRILPRDVAGVAFEYLPLDQQTELVQMLGSEQLANVLNEMAPDDRTRLFEELPAEVTRRALETLKPEELKVARQLLGYAEGTAGRFMTPEYLALKPSDDRARRRSTTFASTAKVARR